MTTKSEADVNTSEIPIVCTMPTDDVPTQLLEWGDLQARAKEVTAIEAGARMRLPASMVDQVRDLVRRESACCAFLNLDISIDQEHLVLEVTAANPDALPVISALAGIPLQ